MNEYEIGNILAFIVAVGMFLMFVILCMTHYRDSEYEAKARRDLERERVKKYYDNKKLFDTSLDEITVKERKRKKTEHVVYEEPIYID